LVVVLLVVVVVVVFAVSGRSVREEIAVLIGVSDELMLLRQRVGTGGGCFCRR
jgi:hypothetical protein